MTYWGLLTPSGIVVPMGRERPKLTAADKADFWKVVRISQRVAARDDTANNPDDGVVIQFRARPA